MDDSGDDSIRSRDRSLAWGVVVGVLALLAAIVHSTLRVETSSSNVQPWFPDGTPERQRYESFERIFGPQDFWLLCQEGSEEGGATAALAEALRTANEAHEPRLLRQIRHADELLDGRTLARAREIRESLSGVFYDREGARPAIFCLSSPYGFENRQLVYEKVIRVAEEKLGSDAGVRIIGPGYLGVMADHETNRTLKLVTPLTLVLSAVFAWVLLRNVRLAFAALLAAGISAGLPIAIVYFSGESLSHLLVVLPALSQLLGLSNSIHLIHYYREARLEEGSASPAWWRMAKRGWLPTVAASVSTAIGFLSLKASSMPVVQSFSHYGAASVLGSAVVVLLIIPASLILLPPGPRFGSWIDRAVIPRIDRSVSGHPFRYWAPLAVVLVVSVFGVFRLETESRMETFFSEDSDFKRNHRWFEKHFGPLQTGQLVGRFPPEAPIEDQLRILREVEEAFDGLPDETRTYSAVRLLGPGEMERIPGNEDFRSRLLSRLESENLYTEFDGDHYWKVTVFHESAPDSAEAEAIQEVRASLDRLEQKYGPAAGDWTLTGTYQLFGSGQKMLLEELLQTFLFAFILITPCVIAFLRSVRLGLVAIFGNLFPIVVLFGSIHFFGSRIDIATMVIASVAFGIAIDDTMHFLTWLTRGLRRGSEPIESIVSDAYAKAGSAILETTLIISIGMLPFLLSDFGPSRRFASLTAVALVLAVVGDLLLLPALILGPFRRFVRGKRS